MPGSSERERSRRLAAELELEREVHSLTIHELGNPLQSLLVLIELSSDELRANGIEGRAVDRLDHALESIERLRQVLLHASGVRASLRVSTPDEPAEPPTSWSQLLHPLVGFVEQRLTQLRANLVWSTAAIDARPVTPACVRAAVLGLLLGACSQIRRARSEAMVVELDGRVLREQTCVRVAIRGPDGPLGFDESVAARLDDLLAGCTGARVQRDGLALVIWSE